VEREEPATTNILGDRAEPESVHFLSPFLDTIICSLFFFYF